MSYKGICYEGSIVGKAEVIQTGFAGVRTQLSFDDSASPKRTFWPGVASAWRMQSHLKAVTRNSRRLADRQYYAARACRDCKFGAVWAHRFGQADRSPKKLAARIVHPSMFSGRTYSWNPSMSSPTCSP